MLFHNPSWYTRIMQKITVHGRFQPPLHVNHRNYVMDAFNRAEKVLILITNPYLNETFVVEASHRNSKENNPFTYEQRVEIFTRYFTALGIDKSRYEFKPFDITNENTWENTLHKEIPNLVNVYGEWSEAKWKKMLEKGYEVIRTDNPKEVPVSGTLIRSILKKPISRDEMKKELIDS